MCAGDRRRRYNSQGSRYYYGKNILGTNGWIDIERTYDMSKSIGKSGSSEKLTTHMQVDKIDVDFGFMTNAGIRAYVLPSFCDTYQNMTKKRLEPVEHSSGLVWR